MKKILLFIGLILFGLANAQNELSKCKFNYELELEKKLENKQKNIYNAVFKWDFSKLNSNINISLEIVPIKDCMNDINSQNNKETVNLILNQRTASLKNAPIRNSDKKKGPVIHPYQQFKGSVALPTFKKDLKAWHIC